MLDSAARDRYEALSAYLIDRSLRCVRAPVDGFRHPWLSPMPASEATAAWLRARLQQREAEPDSALAQPATGDGFATGDYSLGLFHHDASEAAIELLRHPGTRAAAAGSLLCLLDGASPSGCVRRALLPHKAREREPSKPVIAQYALRATQTMGEGWADRHRVHERVVAFVRYLEREYTGLHGLFLTHSSLQSGFDNDVLTAGLPDRSVEGPDTNAFMVLEYRALAELERRLGGTGAEWDEKAEALRDAIERLLWHEDERGGFYVALRWQHGVGSLDGEIVSTKGPGGRALPLESWTGLLPLYAGIPSSQRAERLIRRLLDPEGYWGPMGVRTLPAWSPYFHQAPRVLHFDFKKGQRGPVSNWCGPVWVLSSWYMAEGLARYGFHEQAAQLAHRTAHMLQSDLIATGRLHESYDDAGRGLWPATGTFLSWNVLALTMLRDHAP